MHYMYVTICYFTGGLLYEFHIFALLNSATVNMSSGILSVSEYLASNRIAGPLASRFSFFVELPDCFPTGGYMNSPSSLTRQLPSVILTEAIATVSTVSHTTLPDV